MVYNNVMLHEIIISILYVTDAVCFPESWTTYKGPVCGQCAALIRLTPAKTCSDVCKAQNLNCLHGWDDDHNGKCSYQASLRSCDHKYKGTSDAICECENKGMKFFQ